MTRISTKEQAISLRQSGHSYNFISDKLKVSKSTLSDWLSKVSYVPNQETIDRIGKARAASGLIKSKLKLESIAMARKEAMDNLGALTMRDLFMLGIGLYIGEGSKTQNSIRVINSNPKIIKLMLRWFKEVCKLTNDNFKIRLHLYPDNDVKKCIKFWAQEIDISTRQFQKSQIDFRKGKKMFKRGKLPYGTAHLSIVSNGEKRFGVYLARKIDAWMDMVLR